MKVVSNSGPILSFARANHLDLLSQVVPELLVPYAVYEDIVIRGAGKPAAELVRNAQWIHTRAVTNRVLVESLPQKLHLGEREAIALAKGLDAALLIDERAARQEAARLEIPYFGSLRILKEAKDRRIIPAVRPVLVELLRAGTYLSTEIYRDFLSQIEE